VVPACMPLNIPSAHVHSCRAPFNIGTERLAVTYSQRMQCPSECMPQSTRTPDLRLPLLVASLRDRVADSHGSDTHLWIVQWYGRV
jgi:hypothetical protein